MEASTTYAYEEWFREVCKVCGLPEDRIDNAAKHRGFGYRGAEFGFLPAASGSDKQVVIHGYIGTLPPEKQDDVLRHMLEFQMATVSSSAPIFGLDPEDDQLVLMVVVQTDQMPPEAMMNALRVQATVISQWRELIAIMAPEMAEAE